MSTDKIYHRSKTQYIFAAWSQNLRTILPLSYHFQRYQFSIERDANATNG